MTKAYPMNVAGTEQPRTASFHRSASFTSVGGSSVNSRKRNASFRIMNGAGQSSVANGDASSMVTKPTFLAIPVPNSSKQLRFLIMDRPKQNNLHLYIKEMRDHSVTAVVRACERSYESAPLVNAGIEVHDMEYADGHSPPPEIIQRWLELVDDTFFGAGNNTAGTNSSPCIAIHCVAGLGRAPQLVALAMVEFANMDAVDAVVMIRSYRKGAINNKQLQYLTEYKKSYRRKKLMNGASVGGKNGGGCCVIQ